MRHLETAPLAYQAQHKIRFVTAASLFDGHDVSINIIRRILQASGCEVIHLGHNRSVKEIITTAIQEDVHGIAISSYQGGHVEFFKYAIDLLKENHASHIKIFGGGGGVIIPSEIKLLEEYGVEKIYSPHDGQTLGLQGIINDMIKRADQDLLVHTPKTLAFKSYQELTQVITCIEADTCAAALQKALKNQEKKIPVLGITGTGGAGKSSLTDELLLRFYLDNPNIKIAILAIDPSKRKTGGALLGDRIRMNALHLDNMFMRSLATRDANHEIIPNLQAMIDACCCYGFDLIIVETPGIGQGDAGIVPYVDHALYVMTPEFGAATQLEKIDMLDYAHHVVINKFDRKGALDALHDVRKQLQRSRLAFDKPLEEMPVFGTNAAQFNDDGVDALYLSLTKALGFPTKMPPVSTHHSTNHIAIIPTDQQRYLAEIVKTIRNYHQSVEIQSDIAAKKQHIQETLALLENKEDSITHTLLQLEKVYSEKLSQNNLTLLNNWPDIKKQYESDYYVFKVRNNDVKIKTYHTSLSGINIPKVAIPHFTSHAELLRWLLLENVPGEFPYTAGVFPFRREGEDPARMFAGEGDPFRTNRRFKFLSEHSQAKRLSTAFDSVTLYGFDPDLRPDIYGKVGNSGVSIATLDDMEALYDGFDLCAPNTSVSMTINGPAPSILAMFLNTAIRQQKAKFIAEHQREPDPTEANMLKTFALKNVRGTVQADILKEDQAQNTCIFSTAFSLKVMADIQEYFIQHRIQNFYSVSISGYHIAEAGANPISQLAFTLSNGFTLVEAYLARGMHVDDFAPNLSFFFSNGMDPEYSVMGRVARRIWAVAMRDKYGANARSQKLKYHIQTSGRSLHAQEMAFNDIRTTLEALIAIYDNCNSLHTNAYDEAVTTPTEESVRRAQAIQLIINKEWGLNKNENSLQGAFIIETLTNLVEEAVLCEFERINERGGVLGAMETSYQRTKIQEESMYYEMQKNDGSLPIVGVNTFVNPDDKTASFEIELARSTDAEKNSQLTRLHDFHTRHHEACAPMLKRLKEAVRRNENVFAVLIEAVEVCSLLQITQALFEVGGKYRRNM
jgi:isobutyryl-CoA mutase